MRVGGGEDRHRPREVGTAGRGGHRLGVELEHQLVEGVLGVAVAVEGALRVGRALGEERRQRVLEADVLVDELLEVVGVGVDGAVEHGGPHRVREQRRPRGAELGAVAEPEVADRVLAQRLADRVHVAGRVVGADELEDVRVLLDALVGEVLGEVDDLVALGLVVGRDVDAGEVVVVVVDAVDRRRAEAGAARVPADDVEGVEQRLLVDLVGVDGRSRCRRRPGPPGFTSSEPTRSPVAR